MPHEVDKPEGGEVMKNWKRRFFYIRRGLIRWAVVFFGTLLAQCGLVWILENPDSRMMFYLISGMMIALAIGNVFYGREEKRK